MKTTVDIAESLLRRAKRLAAERGTTLRALIEAGLRHELEGADAHRAETVEVETQTFAGRGLQPGVSWGDWGAFRDLSYEGRGG